MKKNFQQHKYHKHYSLIKNSLACKIFCQAILKRGLPSQEKAQGLRPCPEGVRGFKSRPPHCLFSKNCYVLSFSSLIAIFFPKFGKKKKLIVVHTAFKDMVGTETRIIRARTGIRTRLLGSTVPEDDHYPIRAMKDWL